ncbi:methionine adenosyltransferase [Candidatus Woesearchaeota archaeon]|jgi:S-adenosylmethionine synthetase|nr:methionine adenosyltransferase [Candidatus Woesearchaeota archaeon]MBT6518755.1 methionine adenosyltransferase [Candidatus Woesearchaeota archaeon]MBT7366955.1 methionine adenosyltransferase [Candidatus Woesearchaeota archaeon]
MKQGKYLFTSESVSEGHPDKVCDQISDAILDECYASDPFSRVACETMIKDNKVFIGGEITTTADVDFDAVTRKVIRRIGYTPDTGFDPDTCEIQVHVSKQSPDISQGVTAGKGLFSEQGAGDQGIMFGYASNETPELMPLPIVLAHKLLVRLAEIRRSGDMPYLRPDSKSQVTVEYNGGKPVRIDAVVVSTQHSSDVEHSKIQSDITDKLIKPICSDWLDSETKYFVNPTGAFIVGGPVGDCGLTGRKIIVDTYGGHGSHGGGAFSGKDPTKVDRSAAYAARYIAKNIVAAKLADKCEVQLAYAIGVAEPVSVLTHCFGTNRISEEKISELVQKHFPLKPADILREFDLRKPIYEKTASYGHFGRNDPDFTWEKTDKAELLREEAGKLSEPERTGDKVPLDGI